MTIGLQTDVYTWLAAGLLAAAWALSVQLSPGWRQQGWRSLPLSLFGYAWMGFGLDIVVRFFMLSYDCVTLGNMTLRLAVLAPDTNTRAILYSAIYWLLFCASYVLLRRRRTAGCFANLALIQPKLLLKAAVPTTFFACAVYYVITRPSCPRYLITPLGLLAAVWMVVAATVWYMHIQTPVSYRRASPVLILVLIPGVFLAWLSPYREHLVVPVLIPVLTAMAAGRKVRIRSLTVGALAFLLVATIATRIKREIQWGGASLDTTLYSFQEGIQENPYFSVIGEPLRRFHSLDSLLVTMAIVPRAVPHSGRNVFVNAVVNGIIPRIIYAGKEEADQGLKFGTSIWSYENASSRLYAGGSIAPSLIGDLYGAGGFPYVGVGAICVGALFGLYEGWKQHLPEYAQVGLTLLVITQVASAIERDYTFVVANFVQMTLMIVVVSAAVMGRTKLTQGAIGSGN